MTEPTNPDPNGPENPEPQDVEEDQRQESESTAETRGRHGTTSQPPL